ncbi:Pathogen-related protein [Melia azedarach]|uniref:Pathogen-related protein n=1 Tax=Melia azedarach TaxID=155640 RepID=A0ACC1WPJ6_MELAZ|nr:Pathogen-related protein [Melia azedarach]
MESSLGVVEDKYRFTLEGEQENDTKWRFGKRPNYDVVNKLFEEGRTKIWPAGSVEEKVQNLVKSWEAEIIHKTRLEDFKTIDTEKYTFSLNGRKAMNMKDIAALGGGYNPQLQTALPKELRFYDPDVETAVSSHNAFTTTFPRGFAVEILQVYSGPPVIVYKFRHWGYMEGPFKGHAPTEELVEFFGMGILELNEEMKIVKVELFYDRGELLGGLLKGANIDSSAEMGASACPVLGNTG